MRNQQLQKKYKRYKLNAKIAYDALLSNKLRAFLSALGVIFGVAAVISMLAIGKGTEQEILNQMKEVGVNNIVITPFSESQQSATESTENGDDKKNDSNKQNAQNKTSAYSPGLRIADLQAIQEVLPNVSATSAYIEKGAFASFDNRYADVALKAVSADYFTMFNYVVSQGHNFHTLHEQTGAPVCLLSENAKLKLLGAKQALGKKIKVGTLWYTVIGTLQNIYKKDKPGKTSDICIYIPVQTCLLRIENNAIPKKNQDYRRNTEQQKQQLDKIIVQIDETEKLLTSSEIINRIMLRRHNKVKDFEVTVPELLLKQQEETKSIFNIVLGIIAGISLLVGGIGIMNIMNASVLERTREIGVRLAIGANKKDISFQFLFEAIFICLLGGIIGVVFGIAMAILIMKLTSITTIISAESVLISFFVTTLVGIFFGYYPAKKASIKDPIESLRYE